MKSLYINNKRALIDDDTYFPITQTISDLETVNTIGLAASKSVNIPICPTNDEIFGYVAEITRMNIGGDNEIGVSFNQVKKCEYILFDESEVVSKGLILITNITSTNYEVTLYDEIIQKIEESADYYLNDCDLYFEDDEKLNMPSTANSIVGIANSVYIKPVIAIKDNDATGQNIRCNVSSGSNYVESTVDVGTECTPIQLKSVKSYDVNLAIPLNNLFRCINLKYPNSIAYSSELNNLFTETHLLTKSPTNIDYLREVESVDNASSGSTITLAPLRDISGSPLCNTNGHKYFDITVVYRYESTSPNNMIGGKFDYNESTWLNQFNYNTTASGAVFSKAWIKLWFTYNNCTTEPKYYEMQAIKDINTTFEGHMGTWDSVTTYLIDAVTVTSEITMDIDFFPAAIQQGGAVYINTEILDCSPEDTNYKYAFLRNGSGTIVNQGLSVKVSESNADFRTGDYITGPKVLPKIALKDFFINTAKFFNIDLAVVNNVLTFKKKGYYITSDQLAISEIESINTANITFDKIKLTTLLPDSDILSNYESVYDKVYGEQIVNTGYSIKSNTKEVEESIAVPFLLKDYNAYAYDRFLSYFNSGYSKVRIGVVNGLEDKIAFGYINTLQDSMYITNDSAYECGFNTTTVTGSTTPSFTIYNPCLYYRSATDSFFASGSTTGAYDPRLLLTYNTFSPYKFSSGVITKSLEMNKPNTNYAAILDSNYPVASTLYYRHHRNMIVDKYSSDTHILTVKLFIGSKLDIYKIYNFRNSYYIVSDITEYDPTTPGIYEVSLMRVNNPNNYINNIIL